MLYERWDIKLPENREENIIVNRIKEHIKNEEHHESYYIMLRNGRILDIYDYLNSKVNLNDTYAYIGIELFSPKSRFHYPFLSRHVISLNAYLSKLGFHYWVFVAQATGLEYVAIAVLYGKYLSIEVSNLDTVVNNLNLPKIVGEALGDKIISGEKELTREEYNKTYNMFISQRLFAGHNVEEAADIIEEYYDEGKTSLAKEVARIAMDYARLFKPYKVCYNMKSWDEVNCQML